MTLTEERPGRPITSFSEGLDSRVRTVVQRMRQCLEHPVSCTMLAAGVNLSTRQLERLFRAEFGCTVKQYYLRLRLQHSLWLLQETDLSVTEVGFASGFQSSNYFATVFGRYFKVTPRGARHYGVCRQLTARSAG